MEKRNLGIFALNDPLLYLPLVIFVLVVLATMYFQRMFRANQQVEQHEPSDSEDDPPVNQPNLTDSQTHIRPSKHAGKKKLKRLKLKQQHKEYNEYMAQRKLEKELNQELKEDDPEYQKILLAAERESKLFEIEFQKRLRDREAAKVIAESNSLPKVSFFNNRIIRKHKKKIFQPKMRPLSWKR